MVVRESVKESAKESVEELAKDIYPSEARCMYKSLSVHNLFLSHTAHLNLD